MLKLNLKGTASKNNFNSKFIKVLKLFKINKKWLNITGGFKWAKETLQEFYKISGGWFIISITWIKLFQVGHRNIIANKDC